MPNVVKLPQASALKSEAAGKYASTVKVGPKGQVVIPKPVRDMFGIKPGDILLLLADVNRGIAIVQRDLFVEFPGVGPRPPENGLDTGR